MEKTVLAIDPGSSKCGMALVKRDEDGKIHLVWRGIVPRDGVMEALEAAAEKEPYSLLVVGSGTTSKDLVNQIRDADPGRAVLVVDEKDTTLQARERYWEHTTRWGWRKLIPATLQVPPVPVDDFVALILAERVLLA